MKSDRREYEIDGNFFFIASVQKNWVGCRQKPGWLTSLGLI
jgi:hypothetical protein